MKLGLLGKVLNFGVKPDMEFTLARNIRIINGLAMLLMLMSIPFMIKTLNAASEDRFYTEVLANLLVFFPAMFTLWLSWKGHIETARYFIIVFFTFFLLGLPLFTQTFSGEFLNFLSMLIAVVLLINHKKLQLLFFTTSIGSLMLASMLTSGVWTIEWYYFPHDTVGWLVNVLLVVPVTVFFVLKAFKSESEQYQQQIENKNIQLYEQQEEIKTASEQLYIQNKRIGDSINYAQRIQKALMPDLKILTEQITDTALIYRPKDVVSGDFF
jgi:hypothetical protein